MNEKKLKTILWMRHLLVAFEYFNDTPEQCWERVMCIIATVSPKELEGHEDSPLYGVDQTVVKNFAKGYMMAMAKYMDVGVANEKMKEKIKSILLKNTGCSEEELMNDIKILYAKTDLLTNGIHIDDNNPITNN